MNTLKNFTRIIFACAMAVFLVYTYAFAGGDVGTVTYVEGRVAVLRQNTTMSVPLREGELIFLKDVIRTKSNSKAEITFKDKSILRLAQNSRVEITDYQLDEKNRRKEATVNLQRGKARTIIAKMHAGADFNILTPNTQGKIKGSDVFTFFQAGVSGMLVSSGTLSVANTAYPQDAVIVTPGNSVVVPEGEIPKGPRPYLEMEKKFHEQDTNPPLETLRKRDLAVIRGVVTKISGIVNITSRGERIARDAKINEIVGAGDTIETGADGKIELKFDNGNAINIKPDSKLLIVKLTADPKTNQYDNYFELSLGKIRATIEKLPQDSSFRVKTPTAISGVRGTIMYVDVTPEATKVLFEGGIGFITSLVSGETQEVGIGETAFADDNGMVSESAGVSNEERSNITEDWEPGTGIEGYSTPEGSSGLYLYESGTDVQTVGGAGAGGVEEASGTVDAGAVGEPPIDIPITEVTGTTTTSGETFNLGSFDTSDNTLELAATESFWLGTDSVSGTASGKFSNPNNYSLAKGNLDVTLGDGTRIWGGIGGTDINNSLEELFYGIYIRPNRETGYITLSEGTGNLNGNFDSLLGTFQASGTFTAYSKGMTTISPDALYYDSPYLYRGSIFGNIGGDISGATSGEHFSLVESVGGRPLYWGVWRSASSGTYAGTISPNWKSILDSSDDNKYGSSYSIMNTEGTDWSSGKLSGTITGAYLDYDDVVFFDSRLGMIFGNTIGTYGLGFWQALNSGTWNEARLAFGGETTHENGVNYALFGGTQSLWSGSAQATFIGDYNINEVPSYALWRSHFLGRTADSSAIYAMAGGTNVNNLLKGYLYGLYIRPDPLNPGQCLAGYLKSTNIAGDIYPDIGMFYAKGDLTAIDMGQTAVSPGDLSSYMYNDVWNNRDGPVYRDVFSGNIGGDITGTFNGEDVSISYSLTDQMWGIWRTESSGTYEAEPQGDWHAVFGGSDTEFGDTGYFIGHINGPEWSNNEFSGNLTGRDIWYSPSNFYISSLGSTTGETIGTYANGAWSTTNFGFVDDLPLQFGGETTHENGVNYALFGGTQSLWLGSPQAIFIGDYVAQEAPSGSLWRFHTLGETSDGASIYGMAGGTNVNNVFKGLLYALYVRPDPAHPGQYLAGYLKSTNIAGDIYPDIDMFYAKGNLAAIDMGQTAVSPGELSSYMYNDVWNNHDGPVYRDVFSGNIGGDIAGTFNGEDISISYSLTDQMWGIWRTESSGTYQAEPQGAWHAVFGSSDAEFGDTGYFLGHINGSGWSGNEFSGTITGKDIWYSPSHFEVSSLGSMTGETIGTYANGAWSATNFGLSAELPLAFGAKVNGKFEEFDLEFGKISGSSTALLGGINPLLPGPSSVTIMGEYTNPDGYMLWTNDTTSTGRTNDGAAFRVVSGGLNLDNSLTALLYAFYIRPDAGGYRAGYLKSTDIVGNFYPGIGMFEADGTIQSYLDLSTIYTPDDLINGNGAVDQEEDESPGLISSQYFSGAMDANDSANIKDQDWGLWWGLSGGNYQSLPSGAWSADMGGAEREKDTHEIYGYFLGTITGGAWQSNIFSGTTDGIAMSDGSIASFSGDVLGTYNNANSWQALMGGTYTDYVVPFYASGPLRSTLQHYGTSTPGHSGLIGLKDSLWDDGIAGFISIGELDTQGYDNFIWQGGRNTFYSYYSDEGGEHWTTFDRGDGLGSFYGVSTGRGGNNSLQGSVRALYIDPQGNAGVLSSDDLTGQYWEGLNMSRLDGTLIKNPPKTAGIDILPADLISNIRSSDLIGTTDRGDFINPDTGDVIGEINQESMLGSMLYISPGLNVVYPTEKWGIYNFLARGTYEAPTSDIWDLSDLTGILTDPTGNQWEGGSWLGSITGTKWSDHRLEGELNAIEIELNENGWLSGRRMSGEVKGTYVEVDAGGGQWQAASAGEWVEVDALLDLTGPVDDVVRLATPEIPITEVYTSSLTGTGAFNIPGGGALSATMNMDFYSMVADGHADGIWAAIINGNYSTPTSDSWNVNVNGNLIDNTTSDVIGTVNATLAGSQWSAGRHWEADVTGSTTTGITLTGVAGGTYAETSPSGGTFTGAGTGTWENPD